MTDASTTGAVERFDPYTDEGNREGYGEMEVQADGEWVRFTDCQAAIQRAEAAERAEAAAWNDAIEAAAGILIAEAESCAGLKAEFRVSSVPLETVQKWLWSYVEQCRALRRAAPTEGEA